MTSGNNIFAGTYNYPTGNGGIFLSTNNGISWSQVFINYRSVFSLISLGSNIFAGTDANGVFVSTNNGTNWTQTALNDKNVYALATIGTNIFAGTWQSGVYRSTNNGTNWTQTALNNENIQALAVSGNNIFAGTENNTSGTQGVYLSTNYGANWTTINQGYNYIPPVYSLLIANNYIFAGTYSNAVWRRVLSEVINGTNYIITEIPPSFSLEQNYPNPFNPSTNIRYEIPKTGLVKIVIFDEIGREVETLVDEKQSPGTYEITFNATNYPSGVYFYRLEANNYRETKRMILIK
jgi:hypothetical protein